MKILEFKNRKEHFKEWLQDVKQENFIDEEVKSAFFIWETAPTNDGYYLHNCQYNCDLEQLKIFREILDEKIKEMEFDKYLSENLERFLDL